MTRIDVLALGYGIDVTWPVLLFWPLFFLCEKKVHVDGLTLIDVLILTLFIALFIQSRIWTWLFFAWNKNK